MLDNSGRKQRKFARVSVLLVLVTFLFLLLIRAFPVSIEDVNATTSYDSKTGSNIKKSVQELVNDISLSDLFAMTFYDDNGTDHYVAQLREEKAAGKRDRYFIPSNYVARIDNKHFNDVKLKDEWQKEVYVMGRQIMRQLAASSKLTNKRGRVADVGAGSGYKLVKYLSPEFETVGFETEPAISHLRQTYPDQTWVDSGKPEETLPKYNATADFDLCICSDVIEHIRDPDTLLKFLYELPCHLYLLSSPKRDVLKKSGPPGNEHHVREWTFLELQAYVQEHGFHVVRALDGIQHATTQFHVLSKSSMEK